MKPSADMSPGSPNKKSAFERAWPFVLGLAIALPAWMMSWGHVEGHGHFLLYREPKLVAAALVAVWLLAAVAWRRPRVFTAGVIGPVLRRPANLILVGFVVWLTVSAAWVRVPGNFLYEWIQYSVLLVLCLVLQGWARLDRWVAPAMAWGLCGGMAVVTVVGLLQWAGGLPFLAPINPDLGALHPSLMGYKNPAALAVLGQLFVLAGLVASARGVPRILLGALLLAEVAYLASLGSRTSYAALAVAPVFGMLLFALRLIRQRSQDQRSQNRRLSIRAMLAATVALGLFGGVLMVQEKARTRAVTLVAFATHPSTFLESDRGTYLRNTVHMVGDHPFGVGLGNWQTHYPVYRLHHRERSFDDHFQVRRAHSDHVQVLGEAGWLGLVLWLSWFGALVFGAARSFWQNGTLEHLGLSVQWVALMAAMATDYLVEIPYNKFQVFVLVALTLAARQAGAAVGSPQDVRATGRLRRAAVRRTTVLRVTVRRVVALALTLIALGSTLYHLNLLSKVRASAALTARYERAMGRLADEGRVEAEDLRHILGYGRLFDGRWGFSKTFFKDYAILAHTALLLGDRPMAQALARRSLGLHPHSPHALRLMARIAEDPRRAEQWQAAYEHVMHHAWRGFELEYPPLD